MLDEILSEPKVTRNAGLDAEATEEITDYGMADYARSMLSKSSMLVSTFCKVG